MKNPFKRKFLVPIDDCFAQIRDRIYEHDRSWEYDGDLDFWGQIERRWGIKRQWKWNTMTNYLVFDSESDYTMFLLKL
jgi:hypothetical protein